MMKRMGMKIVAGCGLIARGGRRAAYRRGIVIDREIISEMGTPLLSNLL